MFRDDTLGVTSVIRTLMLDGSCYETMLPKEALRMPGVKKHFQESEDSSKGEFIHGHMFEAVGALIGKGTDSFCVPLRMGIQEGHAGDCILLLDRLFLTTQAIRLMGELNLCIICGTTFLPLWHQTLIRQ